MYRNQEMDQEQDCLQGETLLSDEPASLAPMAEQKRATAASKEQERCYR